MKMFGIDSKVIEKLLSNLGDLKNIRDAILNLKYSDLSEDCASLDDAIVYNQAIDDCINVIDFYIKGGGSSV